MRTSIVFLAIVGLTVAGNLHSQSQSQWQANQEYVYEVYSKTLTALPDLRNQYVGVVTRGKLIVQAKSENQIVGKLVQASNAHFHDSLTNGFESEIPEQEVANYNSPLNNKAFVVNYNNGVVKSVIVDNSMTNDDVNQLKAILSQLQVDVSGSRVISCRHNQLPENDEKPYGLFKTMEPSVTGECETLYEINPLPAHIEAYQNQNEQIRSVSLPGGLIEIVKTINYKNCDSRRGYHYGIAGQRYLRPNTNQIGEFLSKSTITKIVLSGSLSQGTIKSSSTINRVAVSTALYQKEKAQVYSEISLTLSGKQEMSSEISSPIQPIDAGNLVYRYSLPSDLHNKIRQSNDEIESNGSSSSASDSSEENQYLGHHRHTRSVDNEQYNNHVNKETHQHHSSSLLSSEEDSNEAFYKPQYSHHYQPRPNMNQAPEHPFHPFTTGQKSLRRLTDNELNSKAKQLINEIAENLQNPNEIPNQNTLEKFDTITDLIRIMNQKQIVALGNELNWHRDRTVDDTNLSRQVYRDAVAQAGTGPSVAVVTKWIALGQIVGNEAASVAETMFSSLRTPTEEILRTLFNQLVKNNVVREQRVLYETVLLSFTDLVRHSYTNRVSAYNRYPVQTYGSFQKELAKLVFGEVIPYLAERLDENLSASNSQSAIVYIRALGNVAHPKIVGVFEKHLESKQVTNGLRAMMTMSLDKLTVIYPHYTQNILYKILSNPEQDPKTRSIAVMLLMRADPPAYLLQTMAQSTNDDDSEIVQAVITSAINSAALLTATEHSELSANAQAARSFLNPQIVGQLSASSKMSDYVAENVNVVSSKQVSYLTGEQGYYPNGLFYHEKKNYGGYKVNEVELQAFISNIENVWAQFHSENHQHNRQHQYSTEEKTTNQKMTNEYLVQKLGVTTEEAQEIEGQLLFKIFGRKNFYSFDENSVKSLPNYLTEILDSLNNGKHFEYNKLYNRREVVISFPLATGHSFVYELKTPTFLQAIGEIMVQTNPSIKKSSFWSNLHKTEVNVSAKIQLVLSTQQMGKVGFLTAYDSQRYVAGQVQKNQLYVPIQAKFNYDVNNNKFSGKITSLDNQKDVNIFQSSSWPFTAHKDAYSLRPVAEAKDIRFIETRPSKTYNKVFDEKTNGLAISVQMEHQISPKNLAEMENHLQNQVINQLWKLPTNMASTLRQVLDGHHSMTLHSLVTLVQPNIISVLNTIPWPTNVMDYYRLNVKYDSNRSTIRAINFAVQVRNEANIKNTNAPPMSAKVYAGVPERKLSIPSDVSAAHNQERQQEFLNNAVFGFQEGSAIVVDTSVVFDSESRAEYVATYAQGQNTVNNRQRALLFVTMPTTNSNTQQLCATYNSYYPNIPVSNFESALNNNEKTAFNLELTMGNECVSSPSHIQITTQMKRTENYNQYVRQSQAAQYEAHLWDQLHFTAQSEGLTKSMNNALQNTLSLLRYYGYINLVQDSNQKGISNQIDGAIQISSNQQYVDLTLQMPESNEIYTSLPLPLYIQHLFAVRRQHQVVNSNQRVCVVDKNEILTFDNSHVQGQTIGKCWYTLVLPVPITKNREQALYNNDQVTVLVRQLTNSKKRQLLVMVGQQSEHQQKILLTPVGNGFTVENNGREQSVSQTEVIQIGTTIQHNERPLMRVYANGNEEVIVSVNGDHMVINFNGERVQIYAKQIYRNNVVGLCGRYNNQRIDDIVTPRNCVLRDTKYFTASWAVTDESCHDETVRNKQKADKAECSQITSYYGGNLVSSFEAGRLQREGRKYNNNYWQHSDSSHSSSSSEEDVKEKHRKISSQNNVNDCHLNHQVQYVEHNGKTCFSMEMVPACAPGCKPINKVEQTVEVHCRNSNDSVAKMYAQQIRRGANPNLSGKKVTKEVTYRVPQACVAA